MDRKSKKILRFIRDINTEAYSYYLGLSVLLLILDVLSIPFLKAIPMTPLVFFITISTLLKVTDPEDTLKESRNLLKKVRPRLFFARASIRSLRSLSWTILLKDLRSIKKELTLQKHSWRERALHLKQVAMVGFTRSISAFIRITVHTFKWAISFVTWSNVISTIFLFSFFFLIIHTQLSTISALHNWYVKWSWSPERLDRVLIMCMFSGSLFLSQNYKTLAKVVPQTKPINKSQKWAWIICIGIITIIGLILRIIQISDIGYTVDSFHHLEDALINIYNTGLNYRRAEIYTLLVAASGFIFKNVTLAPYIPNIIASTATIPLIFYLGNRVFNRQIGLIAASLLAVSSWHILDAANIRMYTIFTFITLLISTIIFIALFNPTENKSWSFKHLWREPLMIFILGLLAFHLHKLTVSFFSVLIAYFGSILPIYLIRDWRNKKFSLETGVFAIGLLCCIAIGTTIYFIQPSLVQGIAWQWGEVTSNWSELSVNIYNSTGWLFTTFNKHILYIVIFLFIVIATLSRRLTTFFPVFFVLAIWFESAFLFNRFFQPRYILMMLPMLILTIAPVIWTIATITTKHKPVRYTIMVLIFILFIPWVSLSESLQTKNGFLMNMEIHYDFKNAVSALPIDPNDGLIQSSYGIFEIFQSNTNISTINRNTNDGHGTAIPTSQIIYTFLDTIQKHPTGWILTDVYRFQSWDCNVTVPCEIRKYVQKHPERFLKLSYPNDKQLIIYRWQTQGRFTKKGLKSELTNQ